MSFDFETHQLCYAEGPAKANVAYAIFPDKRKEQDGQEYVFWMDGDHERAFRVAKILRDEPGRLEFVDGKDRHFRLVPLTLDIYRKKLRQKLIDPPAFRSESAMRHHFLEVVPRFWR